MLRRCLLPRYVGLALAVAVMLGCFPAGVEARMVGSMASGEQGLTARQAREAEVNRLLAEEKVGKALASAGLTAEQVRSRLDRLSDAQLAELSGNLQTIKGGGNLGVAIGLIAVILIGILIYMVIEAN